ncbi:MAG TPA: hypothetical protein VEC06_05780 [Paucimonas sp.]|nr:hypothetical protein [Paucimonas sp.]
MSVTKRVLPEHGLVVLEFSDVVAGHGGVAGQAVQCERDIPCHLFDQADRRIVEDISFRRIEIKNASDVVSAMEGEAGDRLEADGYRQRAPQGKLRRIVKIVANHGLVGTQGGCRRAVAFGILGIDGDLQLIEQVQLATMGSDGDNGARLPVRQSYPRQVKSSVFDCNAAGFPE